MEPENDGFQKESPFPGADCQMNHVKLHRCMLESHPLKMYFLLNMVDFPAI